MMMDCVTVDIPSCFFLGGGWILQVRRYIDWFLGSLEHVTER